MLAPPFPVVSEMPFIPLPSVRTIPRMNAFNGFSPKMLTFFRQLASHNDREWFNAHRKTFDEHVQAPMLALLEWLNTRFARFAPDHVTEPKRALYRIYRDTRFAKDKTPFKLHMGAMFGHRRLPKNYCAGYYVHVAHTECFVGCGLYMPEPDQLKAVRAAILDRHDEFLSLIRDKKLRKLMGDLQGDQLARLPKGYDPAHPAADLMRLKQLSFHKVFPAKLALEKSFATEVAKRFEACAPFNAFLNEAILTTVHEEESDTPKRPAPMF